MAIPIFFVHKTNSPYLKYALKQARKYNPDSNIYLLGDNENNKYPFINHVNIADYSESAKEFSKVYKHMSATNIDYELFCFLRWFYIKDFAEKNNIESFIYLDSDVLVFSNLTEALIRFKHLSIANEGIAMPAFTYFGNYKALDDFCCFMIKQYVDTRCLSRLESEWEIHKPKNWGGICDMVMFQFYFNEYPEALGKLDVIINDTTFDQHIRISDGFEMEGDHKKLRYKNGHLSGYHLSTQKWIRFHGIHFQGHSKALMYKYYSGGGYLIERYKEYYNEIRNKYQFRTWLKNIFITLFNNKNN